MPMPMADLFAPDVNFLSARGVYPTAAGGTVASVGASLNDNTAVSMPSAGGGAPAVGVTAQPFSTSGRSLYWWIGFLVFLIVMVFVARKAGGEEDFRNIRPTLYNFLTITMTAVVGIVGLKVIFTKFPVPGATDVILAV